MYLGSIFIIIYSLYFAHTLQAHLAFLNDSASQPLVQNHMHPALPERLDFGCQLRFAYAPAMCLLLEGLPGEDMRSMCP